MITTIFDLSNMFHRSMFMVGGYGEKSYSFDNQFELDQLMRKIAIDVSYTMRQLNPSRVIFALDSKSWRKEIEIEENEGYKAHRTKASNINWENVYNLMDEFSSIMTKQGFVVSRVKLAEADDIMMLWRDKIQERNEHTILVTGDEDLRQLVTNHNEAFTAVFNPFTYKKGAKRKLYVPTDGFKEFLDNEEGANDIWNTSSDYDQTDFKRILAEGKVEMVEIDGDDVALKKVFCGDDGDNVPAIYTWLGKTSKGDPKTYRITESKYRKIKENLGLQTIKDLEGKEEAIYQEIAAIAKHDPPFNPTERINRQLKLVALDREVIPSEIVETFEERVKDRLDKKQRKVIGANMESLLEGTRYISEKEISKASESSIFKEMDRISKKLF